jgi:hypothetical protein
MLKRVFTWKTVVRTAGLLAVLLTIGLVAAGCKHDSDSGGGGKPAELAAGATKAQALEKLDQIISYCDSHSNPANTAVKTQAEGMKTFIESCTPEYWTANQAEIIEGINVFIIALQ